MIDEIMVSTLTHGPSMTLDWDCLVDQYPDRPSWLEARRSRIQASDTAGIFGVGYSDQSPITIYDSKVNAPRETADPSKLRRFKVGKLMEPALRAIFADESGMDCESAGEFTIYRHPDLPWLGATLDAVTVHDEFGACPVELKNVSNFAREEWDGDEPPLKFNVQVQHQLAVTGASHGFLLGLIGGYEPIIRTIERNDRFIETMLAKLEEFWGYVQRREIPPIDASEATGRILAKLYPKDSGATVALPADAVRWAAEKTAAAAIRKEMEAVESAADNQLKGAIGEATFGDMPFGSHGEIVAATRVKLLAAAEEASRSPVLPPRYSWKHQSRAAHSVKASEFRVLRGCK